MMEKYWAISSSVGSIMDIAVTAICLSCFVKPFLQKKKTAWHAGIIYFTVMTILYCVPYEMEAAFAYAIGTAAVLAGMYAQEHRNLRQKVFLAVTAYIIKWIAGGMAIIQRNILMKMLLNLSGIVANPWLQLGIYVTVEMLYIALQALILLLFSNIINRRYIGKKEELTKSEFILMLAPLLSVMTGYWFFSFFRSAYEQDLHRYIWNEYIEYEWLLLLYQITSYAAILTTIIIFQKIKGIQREEKENVILEGQIQEIKRHIGEVEKLYDDIRSLKHDIGNHMMTLNNLYKNNQHEDAQKYAEYLKDRAEENIFAINSGNPVTDVILSEKKKEAQEKGIAFACDFFYPENTQINVFDISIILHNAVNNAIEAAQGCEGAFIRIVSYSKKNVYMLEIENASERTANLDEYSGLPETTKENAQIHGFGIANIRKVARSYQGDIDIEQGAGTFKISIMLIMR